tara:strand:- start:1483 stop:1728 length:246 start_codon:yes stop_codon:yes gene_type:complete
MTYALHRQETIDGVTTKFDVEWWEVRQRRDKELKRTDFWALSDMTLSTARRDYRQFLRDLPSSYSSANEAADAWSAYNIPE